MIHVTKLLSVINRKSLISVRKINRLSKKMTIMSTVTEISSNIYISFESCNLRRHFH